MRQGITTNYSRHKRSAARFYHGFKSRKKKKIFKSHRKEIFFEKDFFYLGFETHLLFVSWKSLFGLFCGYAEDEKKEKEKQSEQLGIPLPPAKFAIWCFLKPAWAKK